MRANTLRPEDKRSHFSQIAPKARKGDEPNHHPALNPDRDADAIRAAVARLRASPTMSALALEFVILTAVRVSEGLGATWDEIDFNTALWTIPAARMKMGREHIVPLSDRAMAIIRALDAAKGKERKHVFPGGRAGRPMGRTTAYNCCERVTGGRASPHGWRSSFRSWCTETGVAFEVAELSLAHGKEKIVAAYDRSAISGAAAWRSGLGELAIGTGDRRGDRVPKGRAMTGRERWLKEADISMARLRVLFAVNDADQIVWLTGPRKGSRAGRMGIIHSVLDGAQYRLKESRLVFALKHDRWPPDGAVADLGNRNRGDAGVPPKAREFPGVRKTRNGKFTTHVLAKGRRFDFGLFDDPEVAYHVYLAAKKYMTQTTRSVRSKA